MIKEQKVVGEVGMVREQMLTKKEREIERGTEWINALKRVKERKKKKKVGEREKGRKSMGLCKQRMEEK